MSIFKAPTGNCGTAKSIHLLMYKGSGPEFFSPGFKEVLKDSIEIKYTGLRHGRDELDSETIEYPGFSMMRRELDRSTDSSMSTDAGFHVKSSLQKSLEDHMTTCLQCCVAEIELTTELHFSHLISRTKITEQAHNWLCWLSGHFPEAEASLDHIQGWRSEVKKHCDRWPGHLFQSGGSYSSTTQISDQENFGDRRRPKFA